MKLLLNEPNLSDLERKYVLDVLASGWLSCYGKHTREFEAKFGEYIGVPRCLAVQSGTCALHLAMKAAGVRQGDCVIVPNYSCGATVSSVLQCGGTPVLLDIEPDTYGLDASRVEAAILKYRPKALQLVHIYGFPARDTLRIADLCKKYEVLLVEDASEALGAELDGRRIGAFGDIATFSIRSEKMIGVGEGGVIACRFPMLADTIESLANRSAPFRGKDTPYWQKYYYEGEGYNYLLAHLLGAVARAQIERFAPEILPEKVRVGKLYRSAFAKTTGVRMQKIARGARSAFWLNSVYFERLNADRVKELAHKLMGAGIEVRPAFWPLSDLRAFPAEIFGRQETAAELREHLLVLPSAYHLQQKDILRIRGIVEGFLDS